MKIILDYNTNCFTDNSRNSSYSRNGISTWLIHLIRLSLIINLIDDQFESIKVS